MHKQQPQKIHKIRTRLNRKINQKDVHTLITRITQFNSIPSIPVQILTKPNPPSYRNQQTHQVHSSTTLQQQSYFSTYNKNKTSAITRKSAKYSHFHFDLQTPLANSNEVSTKSKKRKIHFKSSFYKHISKKRTKQDLSIEGNQQPINRRTYSQIVKKKYIQPKKLLKKSLNQYSKQFIKPWESFYSNEQYF